MFLPGADPTAPAWAVPLAEGSKCPQVDRLDGLSQGQWRVLQLLLPPGATCPSTSLVRRRGRGGGLPVPSPLQGASLALPLRRSLSCAAGDPRGSLKKGRAAETRASSQPGSPGTPGRGRGRDMP